MPASSSPDHSAERAAPDLSLQISQREPCDPSRRGLTGRVIELDLHRDPRYGRLVESHPNALVFHQPGWLRALEVESGRGLVILGYEDESGNLDAVLPLMRTRGLPFDVGAQQTGRRLCCLPRTPAAGPVFTHEAAAVELLRAAAEKARREDGLQLQIKCGQELPQDGVEGLLCSKWRPTYVLEIPDCEEKLSFGDARHRRQLKWAVQKAQRNGVSVRAAESEAELRAWYPLYLRTMRRNAVPPRPLRFFLVLWEELFPIGVLQLQLAEQQREGRRRLVAGSIFLRFRETAWYAFNGSAEKDLCLHPNDLILWHAIHQSCGTGTPWMDLGEVTEDHPELARFKTKWGARPREQYRYCSGPAEGAAGRLQLEATKARTLGKVWRHLPLTLTAWAGDWIYRHL